MYQRRKLAAIVNRKRYTHFLPLLFQLSILSSTGSATDREATSKVLAKYTKVQDPEILSELYRIYGVKYLEPVPRVKLEAVEEVLRSEVKGNTAARATDFVDNSLVAELEQQGLFQALYR